MACTMYQFEHNLRSGKRRMMILIVLLSVWVSSCNSADKQAQSRRRFANVSEDSISCSEDYRSSATCNPEMRKSHVGNIDVKQNFRESEPRYNRDSRGMIAGADEDRCFSNELNGTNVGVRIEGGFSQVTQLAKNKFLRATLEKLNQEDEIDDWPIDQAIVSWHAFVESSGRSGHLSGLVAVDIPFSELGYDSLFFRAYIGFSCCSCGEACIASQRVEGRDIPVIGVYEDHFVGFRQKVESGETSARVRVVQRYHDDDGASDEILEIALPSYQCAKESTEGVESY